MNILLLEPDPMLCITLRNVLETQECTVFSCDGHPQRLMLSLRRMPYDCVLLNYQQTTFSGKSLLGWLKGHISCFGIIVYSAFPWDEREALEEGASLFLKLPFTMKELCQALGQTTYSSAPRRLFDTVSKHDGQFALETPSAA